MKKNGNKERLFEMMKKINPNFSEQYDGSANKPIPADVAYLQKATDRSASVKYAASRIDTPQEFQDSFQEWLSSTGFNPQKKPLSIAQAQTLVRNAMLKLGYR